MRQFSIRIEPPALRDIEEAYVWLAAQNSEAAVEWFDSLYETIATLESFPERCPLAPERKSFKREVRQLFHGRKQHKYRILFTIVQNSVHVLHVRHGARLAMGEEEISQD